jgi:fatty-acyl-CoA synthase
MVTQRRLRLVRTTNTTQTTQTPSITGTAMSTDELHRPLYVPDLIVNALNQTPERPLIQLAGGPMLTIGEVRDATSQFMLALQSMGVARGQRIAILSTNRPEVLHVGHAISLLAAISVPMHPLSGLADHLHVLRDAQADVLVFDADRFNDRAREIREQLPELKLIAFGESSIADDLGKIASRFQPAPLKAPKVDGASLQTLRYSGGTTGKPKAIPVSHRVSAAVSQIIMAEFEWPEQMRVLSCSPLSHAGSAMVLPTMLRQGWILIQPGFDPVAVMSAIQEHKITCMLVVPTMIYALLDHPRFSEFDLSSLETVLYGASAMAPARLKEAIQKIGPVFSQFYGQAEAPMALTVLRKSDHDVNDLRRLASCGRPTPWVRLELLDANQQPVKDGEPGEICVQGPLVMDGYRDNPELTAEAFKGGWLHTGDVAVRDPGGFLRIVDRTKDMIVTGGFNVYPREIEDIIGEHSAVSQVAVIGVPHPKWGEAVKALIVLRPGATVEIDVLTAMVSERKGSFQAPKYVEFIDVMPQTAVGKPDKKVLRAKFGQAIV